MTELLSARTILFPYSKATWRLFHNQKFETFFDRSVSSESLHKHAKLESTKCKTDCCCWGDTIMPRGAEVQRAKRRVTRQSDAYWDQITSSDDSRSLMLFNRSHSATRVCHRFIFSVKSLLTRFLPWAAFRFVNGKYHSGCKRNYRHRRVLYTLDRLLSSREGKYIFTAEKSEAMEECLSLSYHSPRVMRKEKLSSDGFAKHIGWSSRNPRDFVMLFFALQYTAVRWRKNWVTPRSSVCLF